MLKNRLLLVFLNFLQSNLTLETLDDVVIALNERIARMDSEVGCPLKAVSFHGEIEVLSPSLLQWEMIVDV